MQISEQLSLTAMMKQAAKEANQGPELSDDHLETLIQTYSTNPDCCLFYNEHGFIMGLMTTGHILFPGIKIALEVAWWVHPEHRKKMHGGLLYKDFAKWAEDNKAEYIFTGIETRGSRKISECYMRKL